MSDYNALDFRFVRRAVYDKYTDRLESKLQRMKADIRELEQTVKGLGTVVQGISDRAMVFVEKE